MYSALILSCVLYRCWINDLYVASAVRVKYDQTIRQLTFGPFHIFSLCTLNSSRSKSTSLYRESAGHDKMASSKWLLAHYRQRRLQFPGKSGGQVGLGVNSSRRSSPWSREKGPRESCACWSREQRKPHLRFQGWNCHKGVCHNPWDARVWHEYMRYRQSIDYQWILMNILNI